MLSKRLKIQDDSSTTEETIKGEECSQVVLSNYFHNTNPDPPQCTSINHSINVCDAFFESMNRLNVELDQMNFTKPVEFVYNPTQYAFDVYKNYIERYCNSFKSVMYLGMNPGPWGMSQTGVPFGEISAVRDFLKLSGNVLKPIKESPLRPIEGFNCTRSEVSGKRFWNLVKELCDSPEGFFKSSFVHNYCPLQLITTSGKNVTPAELKNYERDKLFEICDKALIEVIGIYKVNIVVCIGKFAETRVKKALQNTPNLRNSLQILTIPHPSPRAVGNTNWQSNTIKLMGPLGLLSYYKT